MGPKVIGDWWSFSEPKRYFRTHEKTKSLWSRSLMFELPHIGALAAYQFFCWSKPPKKGASWENLWNSRVRSNEKTAIDILSGWWFQLIFYFHPELWGRWTHFDEHIFQVGWFNHQPAYLSCWKVGCDLLFTHWFSTRRVRFNSFQLYMDLSTVFFGCGVFFLTNQRCSFKTKKCDLTHQIFHQTKACVLLWCPTSQKKDRIVFPWGQIHSFAEFVPKKHVRKQVATDGTIRWI